jgi:glutamyl-tRNA reductase
MAKLTGSHLQSQQVKQLTLSSRTLETAQALAAHLKGHAVAWSSMDQALVDADIVVTATGATEPVLTRAIVESDARAAPSAVCDRHRRSARRRSGGRESRRRLPTTSTTCRRS